MNKSNHKKIALLISGHTRSVGCTIENICEIKRVTGCDVYVHRWVEPEMTSPTWRQPEKYVDEESVNRSISRLLQPKGVLVESSEMVSATGLSHIYKNHLAKNLSGAHFMIYGIWRLFRMVVEHSAEQNTNYDVIIRYRFDLFCPDPKKILEDINDVVSDSGCVKMPEHNWAKEADLYFDGVLIAGFKTYSTIIDSLPFCFHDRFLHLVENEKLFPELLIIDSITSMGIMIKPSVSEFHLIRKNGLCEQKFVIDNSLRNRIASMFAICEFLNNSTTGYIAQKLTRRCHCKSNHVLFRVIRVFHPLIKLGKKLFINNKNV
jgi:hypothetical protein